MPRTSVNRAETLYGTSSLRSVTIDTGVEYGGSTYNNDATDVFGIVSEVRDTVNSPNWNTVRFERKKRWDVSSILHPNPFGYTYSFGRTLWGKFTQVVPSQGFISTKTGRITTNPPSEWGMQISEAEKLATIERAKMKIGGKFKNQRVNLAQAYGERGQVVRLFNDTAHRVMGSIKAIRKGDVQGAAEALGVVSKARKGKTGKSTDQPSRLDLSSRISQDWLALQYGWKPLMSDLYGSVDAIAQAHVAGHLDTVRHSASSTLQVMKQLPYSVHDVIGRQYATRQYTAKYVIRAAVQRPVLQSVTSLGLTNPLAVAWELMPWSFVIDWFIRIGDYLGYLDSYQGYDFLDGSFTIFERMNGGLVVNGTVPNIYGGTNTVDARGSLIEVVCSRQVLYAWPTLSPPRLKNPFSVTHALNALALFRTTFFRRS